jgi:general secretion pathway protein E
VGAEIAVAKGLVDILAERGKLDAAAVARVRGVEDRSGERAAAIVTRLGLAGEADVAAALAAELGLTIVEPAEYPASPVLADQVTEAFLRKARVLPLADAGPRLVLAMVDPHDRGAIEALQALVGKPVAPRIALAAELEAALDRLYGARRPGGGGTTRIADAFGRLEQALGRDDGERQRADVERVREGGAEAPAIQAVQALVARALAARASDIHIEPMADRIVVRIRVDGVLCEIEPPAAQLHGALVGRIKVLARLDVAERRLPQDGRARFAVAGREVDVRVSIVPTVHGESVALRLLDQARAPLALDRLGFSAATLDGLARALIRPNGIVLVTGPTGSGKTTTLYAALGQLEAPERKIVSVEDPVEYQLAGITQIQVKPDIGLGFPAVLRAVLRHDPDVIMIGEIRDAETAQIAIQAALTGHLVLATLHTNSAAASIARLLDMGVPGYLLTATLAAVLGQRLVRRLCPACSVPIDLPADLLERLGVAAAEGGAVRRAVGCAACGETGFAGRSAVGELLAVTPALQQLIIEGKDAAALHAAAQAAGMRDLYAEGLALALDGGTSIEEVLRVVSPG